MASVLIPLDEDTVAALTNIENFVKTNVDSPRYKPLWLKKAMYANVSKWCNYELMNHDGTHQTLPNDLILGSGLYSFQIHVSHVYIGPHKGGETFSLSLHVTNIKYEPEQNVEKDMTDFLESLEPKIESLPTKQDKKQKRRKLKFEKFPQ